jgi:hypothetical protein
MDASAVQRRVQRTIGECRALGIEPGARTVAEIMVDEDVTAHKYEDFSSELAIAFVEYENAAVRALTPLTIVPPASDRRSA